MKGEHKTDYKGIIWIIVEQKLDSWDEMDKCQETYNFLKLKHEKIEIMNRFMTGKDIESII